MLRTLAGVRIAIGVGAWATPRLAGRLFGARDVALAWGALGSSGDARRQWLLLGLACDGADALAGVAGGRAGYLPTVTSALVTGTALAALGLGALALREA